MQAKTVNNNVHLHAVVQ